MCVLLFFAKIVQDWKEVTVDVMLLALYNCSCSIFRKFRAVSTTLDRTRRMIQYQSLFILVSTHVELPIFSFLIVTSTTRQLLSHIYETYVCCGCEYYFSYFLVQVS